MEKLFSEKIAARRGLSCGFWELVTAVLQYCYAAVLPCKSIGVSEPVLLAAFGALKLGAAFYVWKPAVHGTA
jgi:hypothetical protein